jgi:hypothetical protein
VCRYPLLKLLPFGVRKLTSEGHTSA